MSNEDIFLIIDNIVQNTNGGKSSKNETKTPIVRQNLPKIIANFVLPKGVKILKGVRIEKLRINNSLQNNIPPQISLEQDVTTRCNNNDKSTDQTFYINDTTENILKEKEHHTSLEINRSFDTLKISSPLNNNFDLKDKNLSNKIHNKVINYRKLNSVTKVKNNDNIGINDIDNEIIMTHENCTLNSQEQLNRFTNNTEVHENNILQDNRKYEERCTKNILNKHISDLMDIDNENCNISTSSVLASKEKTIKETLKRTLKEKDEDCNRGDKKMKLNRNSWLQNNVFKSSNYQQYNDSLSSVTTNTTVETNISKKHNQGERPDLRKFLNQMKSEKSLKLKPTVESKYNN